MAQVTTPDWVKDAVFYQIFPDRFARSERVPKPANLELWDSSPTVYGFKGGDLLGVAEHLDYLQDLGITAIYFNPIFRSAANHRYHTHDYYRVDPILGGDQAFSEMLDAAHARGIQVVLDGVFNHAGRGFYQFYHTLENGHASPYLNWFHFDEEALQARKRLNAYPPLEREQDWARSRRSLEAYGYQAWWDLPALPQFNTDDPDVRRFIFDVARHWVEQGIDGWRLDVPFCIDDDGFWQEFRRVVKEANPDAYIVGEIVTDATRWLQGDQFDAVMNYLFAKACLGFFGGERVERDILSPPLLEGLSPMGAGAFAERVEGLLAMYPREAALAQLNLLDSHDTPRFLTMVQGDKDALRLATLFQMTYPGAPSVYYGNEIGMEGGPDPDCRRAFPWEEDRWDTGLLGFFRRAIALRHEHSALRQGCYVHLCAEDERSIYAFARRDAQESLVVVLNNGADSYTLDLPAKELFAHDAVLRDQWGDVEGQVVDGRITGGILPARSGAVLTELPRD
ncbi:MAG: alpha-amylase family glycosyl hydrolase [Anaerolineae bacterium]|jgi:neopullulanase